MRKKKKRRGIILEWMLLSDKLLPWRKRSFVRKKTTFQGSVVQDDYMDTHIHKCDLANNFVLIFSKGMFWNLQNFLWDFGVESASSEAPLVLLCSFIRWQPHFGRSSATSTGLWDGSNVPLATLFYGETNSTMPNFQEIFKKDHFLWQAENNSLQVRNICIDIWFLAAQTYFGVSFSLSSTAGCLYRLLAVYIRSIHRTGCLYQTSNKFHSTLCV